jgi:hypothetical protein
MIVELGYEFVERFGRPDVKDGKCTKVSVTGTIVL